MAAIAWMPRWVRYGRPLQEEVEIARFFHWVGGQPYLTHRGIQAMAAMGLDLGSLMEETERTIAEAWALARTGQIPPPLVDSPKCPGCSLVGICLPDETNSLRTIAEMSGAVQLSLYGTDGVAPRKPVAPRCWC